MMNYGQCSLVSLRTNATSRTEMHMNRSRAARAPPPQSLVIKVVHREVHLKMHVVLLQLPANADLVINVLIGTETHHQADKEPTVRAPERARSSVRRHLLEQLRPANRRGLSLRREVPRHLANPIVLHAQHGERMDIAGMVMDAISGIRQFALSGRTQNA